MKKFTIICTLLKMSVLEPAFLHGMHQAGNNQVNAIQRNANQVQAVNYNTSMYDTNILVNIYTETGFGEMKQKYCLAIENAIDNVAHISISLMFMELKNTKLDSLEQQERNLSYLCMLCYAVAGFSLQVINKSYCLCDHSQGRLFIRCYKCLFQLLSNGIVGRVIYIESKTRRNHANLTNTSSLMAAIANFASYKLAEKAGRFLYNALYWGSR